MNIFYLNHNPKIIAQESCDEHIRKMGIETAQMLSTAHRYLDGKKYYETTESGRKIARYGLNDDREPILYKASHINHPSSIWVRSNNANYMWTYELFLELMEEFIYRFKNDTHKTMNLIVPLGELPNNIKSGEFHPPPQAMPAEYHNRDTMEAYKNFYRYDKVHFASWKKGRSMPMWMNIND